MSKKKKNLLSLPSLPRYQTVIVVPCFNEEFRLEPERFAVLSKSKNLHLLFVNDGSSDNTLALLDRMAMKFPRTAVLNFTQNRGKAEAVRLALIHALEEGAEAVGFLDADLSTSPEEMLRLCTYLRESEIDVILGTRIRMLGTEIARKTTRHTLGRIFATLASSVLGIGVYDTQCGAKLFMDTPALRSALSEPFHSRWAFDVELLGRLLKDGIAVNRFIEVPLRRWIDVGDSKVRMKDMLRMGWDLVRIYIALRQRKAQAQSQATRPAKSATRRGK